MYSHVIDLVQAVITVQNYPMAVSQVAPPEGMKRSMSRRAEAERESSRNRGCEPGEGRP
jgi:hypothetical protein